MHRGSLAPEVHHFLPLITYSSPSLTIDDSILVASDEATAGSVIANAERIVPSSNGFIHSSLTSSEAYLSKVSILPVSGAEQLNASGSNCVLPINSHKCPYS